MSDPTPNLREAVNHIRDAVRLVMEAMPAVACATDVVPLAGVLMKLTESDQAICGCHHFKPDPRSVDLGAYSAGRV